MSPHLYGLRKVSCLCCSQQGEEGSTVQCMRMPWEAPVPDLHPDVILGADLLYDPGGCLSDSIPRLNYLSCKIVDERCLRRPREFLVLFPY